jgi:hypothetical protein
VKGAENTTFETLVNKLNSGANFRELAREFGAREKKSSRLRLLRSFLNLLMGQHIAAVPGPRATAAGILDLAILNSPFSIFGLTAPRNQFMFRMYS